MKLIFQQLYRYKCRITAFDCVVQAYKATVIIELSEVRKYEVLSEKIYCISVYDSYSQSGKRNGVLAVSPL